MALSKTWTLLPLLLVPDLFAADYYVSAAQGGGRAGTREQPAADLGNIASLLKPGDRVFIAGGVYKGRAGSGSDVLTVPVSISGGWDPAFTRREPWGVHRTILSGDNLSSNWQPTPRLLIDLAQYNGETMPPVVVDGLIFDESARNRYESPKQWMIQRRANPRTGEKPSPDTGSLVIRAGRGSIRKRPGTHWTITVENNVVVNSAASQGALSVSAHQNSEVTIRNNIVVNNSGTGIYAGSRFNATDGSGPRFLLERNTVLFTWRFDSMTQSYSGNSFHVEASVRAHLRNNAFAFADRYGINNAARAKILLENNLIAGNQSADYLEFDTKIALAGLASDAENLDPASKGNAGERVRIPVDDTQWSELYAQRLILDRNQIEANIRADDHWSNDVRSILGLPLRVRDAVNTPTGKVWLHRMSIDTAIRTGSAPYLGRFGSAIPR